MNFGFNFGFSRGEAAGIFCPRPQGEIFDNRNFDCGTEFWELDPNFGGTIADNGDGTITLTATDRFSSITQLDKFPIPPGDYHIGVVVTSITGKGKYSVRDDLGNWYTPLTFDAPGTYEADISVGYEITAIDIGADDDASAVITFDGVACIDTAQIPMPDWYKIGTLDPSNILGVWDATWLGIGSTSDFLVNLDGTMPNMTIDAGSPSWNGHNAGFVFGGSGAIKSRLPDGIDMRDLSVIMEFHEVQQNNAALDAFYSHYLTGTNGHYTLQSGWNVDKIRWSAGSENAGTIEEGSVATEGVVATCGLSLYLDGLFLGSVDDNGEATASSALDFRLGCIWVGSRTQFSKFKLKKLLIVDRVLTTDEVQEITENITGVPVDEPIVIDDITEDTAGSCEYPAGDTCIAESVHTATVSNETGSVTYTWSVDTGTITDGQGTSTVTVQTEGDSDTTFNLTCEVSDDNSTDSLTEQFTHTRTEESTGHIFEMLVTSASMPGVAATGGTLTIDDNGDGTYTVWSDDPVTRVYFSEAEVQPMANDDVTEVDVISCSTITSLADFAKSMNYVTRIVFTGSCTVTNMESAFYIANRLEELDLTNVAFSGEVDFYRAFSSMGRDAATGGCVITGLEGKDVTISRATEMFNDGRVLGTIDLSAASTLSDTNWGTSFNINTPDTSVTAILLPGNFNEAKPADSMANMFKNREGLTCINHLDTTNATNRTDMFLNCTSLVQPDATAQADLADTDGATWVNPGSCP